MKSFLMKNSILKIISLVLGILLWFYVIIVIDPSITVTFDEIPIKFAKEDALMGNKLAVISKEEQFVSIEVTGSRKTIADIDKERIYAEVDLSKVKIDPEKNTDTVDLLIDVTVPYGCEDYKITEPGSEKLPVTVERIESETRNIIIDKVGELPEGYKLAEEPTAYEKTIKVIGPKTYVNRIDCVKAVVNIEGKTKVKDIVNEEKGELLYFVSDGKVVANSDPIATKVEKEFERIKVDFKILKIENDISVEVDLGEYADNFEVVGSVKIDAELDTAITSERPFVSAKPIESINPDRESQQIECELITQEGVTLSRDRVNVLLKKIK